MVISGILTKGPNKFGSPEDLEVRSSCGYDNEPDIVVLKDARKLVKLIGEESRYRLEDFSVTEFTLSSFTAVMEEGSDKPTHWLGTVVLSHQPWGREIGIRV